MTKDTKTKLLDAAEILFCEQGIAATSIRNIISKANVNIASVHYHFGCKQQVVKAVFERRLNPVNNGRIENLDRLEKASAGKALNVYEIVNAFLSPAIRLFNSSKKEMIIKRLIGRIHSEPNEVIDIEKLFEEVFDRFFRAFSLALPHISKNELLARFSFMIGAMGLAFLDKPVLMQKKVNNNEKVNRQAWGNWLIQFVTAGFEASETIIIEETN